MVTHKQILWDKDSFNTTYDNTTEVKEKYYTAISEAKLKQYKSNTKFLHESNSKDSTQSWHRYDKVLGRKTNNTVEPIYNTESGLHIFMIKKYQRNSKNST